MSRGRRRRTVDAQNRQQTALQLRLAGHSYDEIADRVGYADRRSAWHAVQRILDRQEAEGVDALRRIEGRRLDAVLAAVWPAAMAGDLAAIDRVLKVSARRAALYGLDMQTVAVRVAAGSGDSLAELKREWLQIREISAAPVVDALAWSTQDVGPLDP